ncbi:MAG: DsbA family protein [Devosia sp.]|nr:DsbA family protein [Devosia sp.]
MMRRMQIVVLFLLAVVGGSVGSAWYFHQAPIETDKAAVEAIVSDVLSRQPKPETDKGAVSAIVADALAQQPKPAPGVNEAGVRSIVTEMLAAEDARLKQNSITTVASLDPNSLDPLIENYLMGNPKILQRMTDALDKQNKADQALKDRQVIAQNTAAIFDDPDNVVLGNPQGDVTLVEMFDYNCGYCRAALPDLAQLLTEDKNLRVELKQFPILSAGSVDAARIAVQVAKSGKDYWAFHQAMYTSRGEVDVNTALDEAKTLGLDPATLRANMQGKPISDALQRSYDLAKALNVTGTPTYIIGDQMIPGAVPIDELRASIANMRACGNAVSCPAKSG